MLKIQELCPLKRFIFASKCSKIRLVAGLNPDPLGEFTALPYSMDQRGRGRRKTRGVGKNGKGEGRGKKEGRGRGRRKGEDPSQV